MKTLKIFLLSVILTSFLTSCGKKPEIKEHTRAIRYMTVKKQATTQARKFTGVIYAVDYSRLSFEDISGRVLTVNVDIGAKVKKGQVLATLDKEKFELDLKDAQAAVKKKEANLVKAKNDLAREQELFKKKVSFKKKLETYEYNYKAAISELHSAKAKLGLAERNLRNTDLKAPYDGYISERMIEPKQEVSKGQEVFRIDAIGNMEVQFDVPENLNKRVKLKDEGTVRFSSYPNMSVKCRVSYKSTAASQGNAFKTKAVLLDPNPDIKPGMSAEVTLDLPLPDNKPGFLIPSTAVLPGKNPKEGYVFIYNPQTHKLKKVHLKAKGATLNQAIVSKGLKAGDIIATAGVSFLADGMKVKLFHPKKQASTQAGE